jgi:hypothetical protein
MQPAVLGEHGRSRAFCGESRHTQPEDSYMRNIIVTMILLLTLAGANGIVAPTANAADNPRIACQNRCLKLDPANYANCKLKCKGSSVCLGHKRGSK